MNHQKLRKKELKNRTDISSQISLVANKNQRDVRVGHGARVVEPRADMVVRVARCHIIDKKSAGSPAIVAPSHSTEAVLASCVPDLQLHGFATDVHDLAPKLDTNCVGRVFLDCRETKSSTKEVKGRTAEGENKHLLEMKR